DIMREAAEVASEQSYLRNFTSILNVMPEGERVSLRAKTEHASERAVLMKREATCLLLHFDGSSQEISLHGEKAARMLAASYKLPAPSWAELSTEKAMARRKREAKQAAELREEEERRAAEAAAARAWYKQQAELAHELGITLENWRRISDLMSKPPPVRVGGHIVMNSAAIGRAVVIDAAVGAAVAAPLQESVKSAAESSSEAR
ncbi:MAG: hypothetical protein SGPRY_007901, partial [Prymnesium sp.]